MNFFNKVKITNGASVVAEYIIEKYSGQIVDINNVLSTINPIYGSCSYSIVDGKPTFSLSSIGTYKFTVYADGTGFNIAAIDTLKTSPTVKLVPNASVGTAYQYISDDNNKILVIPANSNITEINVNNASDGDCFYVHNLKISEVPMVIKKTIGGMQVLLLNSNEYVFITKASNVLSAVIIASPISKTYNMLFPMVANNNIVDNKNDIRNEIYVFTEIGDKQFNIPLDYTTGRPIYVYNLAISENVTINLPSGDIFYNNTTSLSLSPGNGIILIKLTEIWSKQIFHI